MVKMYIATAVDTGDTCDKRARVIATGFTHAEVQTKVNVDMQSIMAWLTDNRKAYIQGSMSLETKDGKMGFLWNIEEVDVDIPLAILKDALEEKGVK